MDEILKSTSEIIKMTSENDTSRALSTVGLMLILMGFVAIFYLCSKKPEEIANFHKLVTLLVISFGILFSIAGPSVTLVDHLRYYKKNWRNVATLDQRIDDLKRNKIVSHVMRLIVYDPSTEGDLKIDRLNYIGPKDQRYTFVADYDELKGLTFTEVARYLGLTAGPSMRISAIIFPTPKILIPVNARGLLKVVNSIEGASKIAQPFSPQQRISGRAWKNLNEENGPEGYAFDNYKEYYDQFCEAATEFRCEDGYTAKGLIGAISRDWDPLGFARAGASREVCSPTARQAACDIHNWDKARERMDASFGVRVFLVQNAAIEDIPQRMLIDVENPDMQVVPYLPEKIEVVAHD